MWKKTYNKNLEKEKGHTIISSIDVKVENVKMENIL